MKKLQIIAKGMLIILLLLSLISMVISAICLSFGIGNLLFFARLHQIIGLCFVVLLIIHFIHRRRKALKQIAQLTDVCFKQKYPSYCNLDRLLMTFEHITVTELAEKLHLPLTFLLSELHQGRVKITDPNKTFRENLKGNDERLFSAITIALKLRFNPNQ
ncbi:hypothetical protein [Lonepinella sp. BR2919]|uniref:hypothetical protein n=1 Tax=unclassified Lonepinella TaxID=2642006 RepID=UPI003F6DAF31